MPDVPNRARPAAGARTKSLQPDYVVPNRGGDANAGTSVVTAQVTVENFRRAQSDSVMKSLVVDHDAFGKFHHQLEFPVAASGDQLRPNRDTLYSAAVFDLDAGPVSIRLPNALSRYVALQVIDQDHYTHTVIHGGGTSTFAKDLIGTRYMLAAVRIFANANDPRDLEVAHALQRQIAVAQRAQGCYDVPNWDRESLERTREALRTLGIATAEAKRTFGVRGQVDPVRHLMGTAVGWGGQPEREMMSVSVTPSGNDGITIHRLSVGAVPVDGFWSLSVYNADGVFEPNARDVYTVNSVTATRKGDNTADIQFGGCEDGIRNCLPITPGWSYTVRLYRPRAEILSGQWKFPQAQPVR